MTDNNRYSLSKPYEMAGEMTPKKMAELDEMLVELYGAGTQDETRVDAAEEDIDDLEDAPAVEAVVLQATVNITELQLESANTTPVTLVAAVAGKVIIPLQVVYVVTVTAAYTTSPTWSLRHLGLAGNISGTTAPNLQATVTTQAFMGALTTFTFPSDPTGIALVLFLNANPGTPGTGVATAKAHVTYYLTDSIASV